MMKARQCDPSPVEGAEFETRHILVLRQGRPTIDATQYLDLPALYKCRASSIALSI